MTDSFRHLMRLALLGLGAMLLGLLLLVTSEKRRWQETLAFRMMLAGGFWALSMVFLSMWMDP